MPQHSPAGARPWERRLRSQALLRSEQFHFKNQRRVGRNNGRMASWAVTEVRRDYQLPFAANLHRHQAFIPALDDSPQTDLKSEWLGPIDRTVNLAPVLKCAGVMNGNRLAKLRTLAFSNDKINVLQP